MRRHRSPGQRGMPWVCLVLGYLIFRNFTRKEYQASINEAVSIPGKEFLPPSCTNFTLLPYRPANSVFGRLAPHGVHGFVLLYTHRLNAFSFTVIGLTPSFLLKSWGRHHDICLWISYSGPKTLEGSVEYLFQETSDGSHRYDYVTLIIRCSLAHGTPKEAGGALFINAMGVDELVYREDPGPKELNPPAPLPSRLTMCSPVLFAHELSVMHSQKILESMEYMTFFGADAFILYDGGGLTLDLARALDAYGQAGMLEFVDVKFLRSFSVDANTVAAVDCAYRARFTAEWVLISAFDEYPMLEDESTRLPRLLNVHAGRPWLSVGTRIWDTTMCIHLNEAGRQAVERMVFKRPYPHCTNATAPKTMCLGKEGLRRLIFDPRKVISLTQHAVTLPASGGVDLSTDVIAVNKFATYLLPAALVCEYPVPVTHTSPRWVKDFRLRKLIHQGKLAGKIELPGKRTPQK